MATISSRWSDFFWMRPLPTWPRGWVIVHGSLTPTSAETIKAAWERNAKQAQSLSATHMAVEIGIRWWHPALWWFLLKFVRVRLTRRRA